MYTEVKKCRICGNANLVKLIELGEQSLTGVFPKTKNEAITSGPLTLVKCHGDSACGLVQLAHSYPLDEMYGVNYGYRSGLNSSMVQHLKNKVEKIKSISKINAGDVIVDIGSNDATTLQQYNLSNCRLIGIDPTASKFRDFYTSNIELIPDFFSAEVFEKTLGATKAKVVTSFSMFYDLEEPVKFMAEIEKILDKDGIWVFEQSYMPLMLSTNSYDTICHEHLEYYSLKQILWMAKKVDLEIVDVELNDINGGSFSITAQKKGGPLKVSLSVGDMIESEKKQKLDDIETYLKFAKRVVDSKEKLVKFIRDTNDSGKTIAALGASTKGNVLLQFCKIDENILPYIGEVNQDKFGSYTPGTYIPIVDEKELLKRKPDYVLVLPWHFRKYFESQPRYKGLTFVYPLPELNIYKHEK
jgi:NDP-4-keto-2,6-dideoxyhexose 3-C-methyltransferase